MLMITRLEKPVDTVTENWYVHCQRPKTPATVEGVAEDIIRYATYPVGAYRTTEDSCAREYLVEFETNDGLKSFPKFYTAKKLRQVVHNILYPYHRIDTS